MISKVKTCHLCVIEFKQKNAQPRLKKSKTYSGCFGLRHSLVFCTLYYSLILYYWTIFQGLEGYLNLSNL